MDHLLSKEKDVQTDVIRIVSYLVFRDRKIP